LNEGSDFMAEIPPPPPPKRYVPPPPPPASAAPQKPAWSPPLPAAKEALRDAEAPRQPAPFVPPPAPAHQTSPAAPASSGSGRRGILIGSIVGVVLVGIGVGVYFVSKRKQPVPASTAQKREAPTPPASTMATTHAVPRATPTQPPPRAPAVSSSSKLRQIALALNAYAANHDGKYPDSLDELVPDYLKSGDLLVDSEQGQPFKYRGQGKDTTAAASEVMVYPATDSATAYVLFKSGVVVPMTRDRLAKAIAEPTASDNVVAKTANAAGSQTGAEAAPTAMLLSWADLVNHPERWPAETRLTVPLRFSGGILRAGTSVRVYEVTADHVTILTPQELAFDIKPNECDLLIAANTIWAALTPEQRAIDAVAVANDASLWPDTVKTKIALTFDLAGGQTRRLPANSQCNLAFYDGTIVCASPVGEDMHLEFKITELDLIERARERVPIDPAKRESRIIQAIRNTMVDADGKPYAPSSIEDVKAFVFFYGANWCGYCHKFSPYLVKFVNENFSQASPVAFVLLDGDDRDSEMLAYMKGDRMPWPAIRKATWKKTFLAAAPQGFPHLLITDRYGRVLYNGSGGGEANIQQHLEALRKLRADVPGGKPRETDATSYASIATRDAEQPQTAAVSPSPRENLAGSASQAAANPAQTVAQVAQANSPSQETRSSPPDLPASPLFAPQPAEAKLLDPAVVLNDCMFVNRDARNAIHTQLKEGVFDQRYRGQRVKYSGIVDAVKKVEGSVVFKGAGKWPENYHVEALFPPEKMSVLDKLQRGQRLGIEADVASFALPQIDTGIPGITGPSRTIKLSVVTVLGE
jgi:thiol-disulfide isomerase/thioredoxin